MLIYEFTTFRIYHHEFTTFRRTYYVYQGEMQVYETWMYFRGWLRDVTTIARHASTVDGGLRRSWIHAGCMKIMGKSWNITGIALLRLKLGQNQWQCGCVFNGHPPVPLHPNKSLPNA